jgi:SH3 domain-containing YSC84-like protein 1
VFLKRGVEPVKGLLFIAQIGIGCSDIVCKRVVPVAWPEDSPWQALHRSLVGPAMYSLGGASAGLQLGGQSTDIVLLVMDQKGVDAILKGKTKLGQDATAAAGPGATEKAVGSGDYILTYARAKGIYSGVSLGSVTADDDANKRIYGKEVAARDILVEHAVQTTDAGKPLISLLDSKVSAHR